MRPCVLLGILLTVCPALAANVNEFVDESGTLIETSSALQATLPPCMAKGQALPIINQQVIRWKQSTANQFLARAHVQGQITQLYPDHNGHTNFEISLGQIQNGTIEIVYNQAFGALPSLRPGMMVEACGDHITSIAQSGAYPPSPDGAILHWIHRNPSGQGHESGYLAIDGVLYGQGNGIGAFLP